MVETIKGESPTWYSEESKNNPGQNALLADTGAVAAVGAYLAQVMVSSDATAVLNLQHRNAANAANVKEQRLFYAANQRDQYAFHFRIDTASERLRVTANATVTGNVCASIFLQKMAGFIAVIYMAALLLSGLG